MKYFVECMTNFRIESSQIHVICQYHVSQLNKRKKYFENIFNCLKIYLIEIN